MIEWYLSKWVRIIVAEVSRPKETGADKMERKKRGRAGQRVLSVVLCLAMLMTTFCIFDIGAVFSSATVNTTETAAPSDAVYFYVPEVIYLRPYSNSWKETTQSDFQFYIQNNVEGANNKLLSPAEVTPKSSYETTGNMYYQGPHIEYFEYHWLDKSGNRITDSKANILFGAMTTPDGAAYGETSTDCRCTITGGIAPSLKGVWDADQSKDESGCYIEWVITYTDSDGETKAVTAYTYVYKPYTVPTGAATYCRRSESNSTNQRDNATLSWMSGFHNIAVNSENTSSSITYSEDSGSAYGYYGSVAELGSKRSTAGFLSPITDKINDSDYYSSIKSHTNYDPQWQTTYSGHNTDKSIMSTTEYYTPMYAAFTSTENDSYNFFKHNNNKVDCDNYVAKKTYDTTESDYNSPQSASCYDLPTFFYAYKGTKREYQTVANDRAAVGGIYVDTSRYNNLGDIPNLGVGLLISDNNNVDSGAFMVADFTDCTEATTITNFAWTGNNVDSYFNTVNYYLAAYKHPSSTDDNGDDDGDASIKYMGNWYRPLDTSTYSKVYKIKTLMFCSEKVKETTISYLSLQAYQTDKSALRAKVNEAMALMQDGGAYLDNGSIKSLYYTSNSWNTFMTAYKNASMRLTLLDGACDVSSLVTALTNAINGLKLATGTAIQYDLYLDRKTPRETGQATAFTVDSLTARTVKTYTARQTVNFDSDASKSSYYDYNGTILLDTETLYGGSTLATTTQSLNIANPDYLTSSSVGFPKLYSFSSDRLYALSASNKVLKTPIASATNDGDISFKNVAAGADSTIIVVNIYVNKIGRFSFNGNGNTNTNVTMPNQDFCFNVSKNLTENAFVRNYNVTYDAAGGTIDGNATQTFSYSFEGWAVNADSSLVVLKDKATADDILYKYPSSYENIVYDLYAVWGKDKLATPTYAGHAFAGWYKDDTFFGGAGESPESDLTSDITLKAKWVDVSQIPAADGSKDNTTSQTAQDTEKDFANKITYDVVKGIDASGNAIYADSITKYDETARAVYYAKYVQLYNARADYLANNNAANSQALLDAGKNMGSTKKPTENKLVNTYNDNFYVGNVQHSLSEMNLNHYAMDTIQSAYNAKIAANAYNADSLASQQDGLNNQVIAMAKAFVNEEKTETSAPNFTVSETPNAVESAVKASAELQNAGISANSGAATYVYPGKNNYTYYCYTSSTNPTILISLDEVGSARTSYPTTARVTSDSDYKVVNATADNATDYSTYTAAYVGSDMAALYNQKRVIALTPDFSAAGNKATATYTISDAHDDASADVTTCNNADSASLASAKSTTNAATVYGETGTITICIDYKKTESDPRVGGETLMRIYGDQVGIDKWLKQYHLFRIAGGSSNWEWPQSTDAQYNVVDPYYGQGELATNCSFAYTFVAGDEADVANNVLKISKENRVLSYNNQESNAERQELIKEVMPQIKANQATIAGNGFASGLGYFGIGGNSWSINYYPQSGAYTYVHIIDRWGNTYDDVIYVGNIDANASTTASVGNGEYLVTETGGSGLSTLSVDCDNIEIVTDRESNLTDGVYTTTGNSVTLSTGTPNTAYTLNVTDNATNLTTSSVKSDENGYITLSFDDEAYTDGVYTFSLNDVEINLFGEVEKGAVESVTYTPSVSTVNTFDVKVVAGDKRVLKVQLVEPDGGTRTYDRGHGKVTITAYNADGVQVDSLARDVAYEIWTLTDINLPVNTEITARAIYSDWTRDSLDVSCKFTVSLKCDDAEVYSAELAETSGSAKFTPATVVTGLDVTAVQFVLANGSTQTYSASVYATESDGKLIFEAPRIWMTQDGLNEITVRVKVAGEWSSVAVLSYTVE